MAIELAVVTETIYNNRQLFFNILPFPAVDPPPRLPPDETRDALCETKLVHEKRKKRADMLPSTRDTERNRNTSIVLRTA